MKKVDCQVIGQIAEMLLDGEPVFLLRAQDAAAVPTLEHYLQESKKAGGQNQLRAHAQMQIGAGRCCSTVSRCSCCGRRTPLRCPRWSTTYRSRRRRVGRISCVPTPRC